jgi:hypothetical protein
MGVQRLPDPRLSTDSMGSGGTPHVSYGGGPPGSTPVEPGPQPFEIPDITDLQTPAEPGDRRLIGPDGSKLPAGEQNDPFPQAGNWAQSDTGDANAAMWKKTPSSSS